MARDILREVRAPPCHLDQHEHGQIAAMRDHGGSKLIRESFEKAQASNAHLLRPGRLAATHQARRIARPELARLLVLLTSRLVPSVRELKDKLRRTILQNRFSRCIRSDWKAPMHTRQRWHLN